MPEANVKLRSCPQALHLTEHPLPSMMPFRHGNSGTMASTLRNEAVIATLERVYSQPSPALRASVSIHQGTITPSASKVSECFVGYFEAE